MQKHTRPAFMQGAVIAIAFAISGCGSGATVTSPSGLLRIASVAPPTLLQSATSPQTLTITGSGFLFTSGHFDVILTNPAGANVILSGSDLHILQPTSFQVSLMVPDAGAYTLVVENSPGDDSSPYTLTVGTVSGGPVSLSSSTPSVVTRNPTVAQFISLTGTGFTPGLVLRITDPTSVVTDQSDISVSSSTSITANVLFSKTGTYLLRLVTPNGDVSNALTVTVTAL